MKLAHSFLDFFLDPKHRNSVSWRFAVLGIVAPSFIYLIASYYYSPLRASNILFIGLTLMSGLWIHRIPFFMLLTFMMAMDAALFAANYFQMSLMMVFDSAAFLTKLEVLGSLTYGFVFLALIISLLATYCITQHAKQNRERLSIYPMFLLVFVYASFDWWLNAPAHRLLPAKNYRAEAFAPIERTATVYAGIKQEITAPSRHDVLLVIVEGLGTFRETDKQQLIWGPLLEADLKEHYDIYQGNVPYNGSTSVAEARELCNFQADYRDFRKRESIGCLPHLALKSGYSTTAFHGFTGTFFERFDWYPKIGFQHLNFLENKGGLEQQGTYSKCGTAFEGMCDADIARSVSKYLLGNDPTPRFAYWLTLNSHKPVGLGEVPERLQCDDGGVFDDTELCRMGEQWLNISYLVKEIAMNPKLQPTEIVLVGDHPPPLFTRHGRNQFEPRKVAWLHLKPVDKATEKLANAAP